MTKIVETQNRKIQKGIFLVCLFQHFSKVLTDIVGLERCAIIPRADISGILILISYQLVDAFLLFPNFQKLLLDRFEQRQYAIAGRALGIVYIMNFAALVHCGMANPKPIFFKIDVFPFQTAYFGTPKPIDRGQVNCNERGSSPLCVDFSHLPGRIGVISEQDSITIETRLSMFLKP